MTRNQDLVFLPVSLLNLPDVCHTVDSCLDQETVSKFIVVSESDVCIKSVSDHECPLGINVWMDGSNGLKVSGSRFTHEDRLPSDTCSDKVHKSSSSRDQDVGIRDRKGLIVVGCDK